MFIQWFLAWFCENKTRAFFWVFVEIQSQLPHLAAPAVASSSASPLKPDARPAQLPQTPPGGNPGQLQGKGEEIQLLNQVNKQTAFLWLLHPEARASPALWDVQSLSQVRQHP